MRENKKGTAKKYKNRNVLYKISCTVTFYTYKYTSPAGWNTNITIQKIVLRSGVFNQAINQALPAGRSDESSYKALVISAWIANIPLTVESAELPNPRMST